MHSGLEESPLTWENVKDGWVWILDGMKTLLETGKELPRGRRRDAERGGLVQLELGRERRLRRMCRA